MIIKLTFSKKCKRIPKILQKCISKTSIKKQQDKKMTTVHQIQKEKGYVLVN